MSTMFADTLLIVFISVCTALLAEGERPPGGARPGRAAAKPGGLGAGPGAVVPSAGGPEAALGWRGGEGRGAGRRLLLACVASPLSAGREQVKRRDGGPRGGWAEREGERAAAEKRDGEGGKRGSVTQGLLRPV